MPYARVLVGTDGSPTAAIAERVATQLAKASDGEVVVVTAYADAGGKGEAERAVAAAGEVAQGAGVRVQTQVVEGEPAAAITEAADRGDADLMVVGDVGMGGPKRFRLGGVADRVSHDMPCDLLIVRTSKGERQGEPGVYGKVLLATDG